VVADHPPTVFFVGVLSGLRVHDGPLVMCWNQEREEHPLTELDYGHPPPRRLLERLIKVRPWQWSIRLEPPPGEDLNEFGRRVAGLAGTTYPEAGAPAEARAVWLTGGVYTRDGAQALKSVSRILDRLGGLEVSAVQIRVEPWTGHQSRGATS
jgi:hypothetical protein